MQNLILAKVESAVQAGSVGALAGQTATVSAVSSTTNLMQLTTANAAQGSITVKLDAARQVGELKALVGKSVMIGKSPATIGGIGNWIVLKPVAATAAAGAAGGQLVMMKVQGVTAAAQLPGLVGKTVTVVQPLVAPGTNAATMIYFKPVAAAGAAGGDLIAVQLPHVLTQAPGLVGNTFTVMPSPVIGGTFGKFLVLKPVVAGTGAKAVAGGAVLAKFIPAAGQITTGTAATTAAVGLGASGGLLATAAGSAGPISAAAAGNSVLGAGGIGLGLGLGLGAWGPVLLGVAGVAGAVSLYGYLRRRRAQPDVSDDALLLAHEG
jgi:hypothetical protein